MGLAEQVASPFDGARVVPGFAATYPNVKIGGVSQPAAWADGVYASPGDPMFILQVVKPDSTAQNVVVGRAGGPGPREAVVTTAPGGSDTVIVTANGTQYTATFLASYTPAVNDRVRLLWQGRDATVIGKVGVTPPPTGPSGGTAPPPGAKTADTFKGAVTDSATWTTTWGWNAGAGQNCYQGNGSPWGGSPVNNGAWFYAGQFAELAGANITRVQFKVPQRISAGNFNASGVLHIYVHNSPTRPGGDVSRVSGPYPVTISPGSGGGYVDLPVEVAPLLIAGGGFSISGDPYMGFRGKAEDPESGHVLIDWNRQ